MLQLCEKHVIRHTQLCVSSWHVSSWIRKTFIAIRSVESNKPCQVLLTWMCALTHDVSSECIAASRYDVLMHRCVSKIGSFYKDIERKIFYIPWKNFPHSVRTTPIDKHTPPLSHQHRQHTSYIISIHLNPFLFMIYCRHCEAIAFWSKTKRTESFYISVERSVSSSRSWH